MNDHHTSWYHILSLQVLMTKWIENFHFLANFQICSAISLKIFILWCQMRSQHVPMTLSFQMIMITRRGDNQKQRYLKKRKVHQKTWKNSRKCKKRQLQRFSSILKKLTWKVASSCKEQLHVRIRRYLFHIWRCLFFDMKFSWNFAQNDGIFQDFPIVKILKRFFSIFIARFMLPISGRCQKSIFCVYLNLFTFQLFCH